MNRRHALPHTGSRIGVNLAAMIDVVFLLLIYFMVATDFRPGEEVFRLDLPQRQQEAHAELFDLAEEPLVDRMLVRSGGGGYELQLDGNWPFMKDAESLGDWLKENRMEGPLSTSNGLFTSRHPIIVVAASGCSWRNVVGVFNAVVGAGYDAVSLELLP
ncbi:MAG: hypothetical protein CMJ39_11880 [Phycisphaerae bacterium]|nr:hypothetical protein [Phycisphaerae bacterium]